MFHEIGQRRVTFGAQMSVHDSIQARAARVYRPEVLQRIQHGEIPRFELDFEEVCRLVEVGGGRVDAETAHVLVKHRGIDLIRCWDQNENYRNIAGGSQASIPMGVAP